MTESFQTFQSPFSWRYGSDEMRRLWSEEHKRVLWRQCWVALAQTQVRYGLVTEAQAADLQAHALELDIPRALALEAEIHHDLMAELKVFASQCPLGGGIIHLGATSMDIKDNAEALQLRAGLSLLRTRLAALLTTLAGLIETHADLPVMAFTHLQPAEPTTFGYRLANIGQDLLIDWQALELTLTGLRGKGFKGAVGNAAGYQLLLGAEKFDAFEAELSQRVELPFFTAATQTYTRKQDLQVLQTLSSLAATLYKFALDLRLLQSEVIGETAEPFGGSQVGSSAMPFKRNPVELEKITSLARELASLPDVAWNNYAHSILERTLDDSANRRSILPEAFLISDEILTACERVLAGLKIRRKNIDRTLAAYAPFAATERVLLALASKGMDRQEAHEILRVHSMRAWEALENGASNPLRQLLSADERIASRLTPAELDDLFRVNNYTGIAGQRSRLIAARMLESVKAAG
jgi:adenylosuccinate lyase